MSEYLELSRFDFDLLIEVPVCGCGDPPKLFEMYRRVLTDSDVDRWPSYTDDATEVVAHVLDGMEATEHGGSVRCCWRTGKGDRLLDILNRYAEDYDRTPVSKQ